MVAVVGLGRPVSATTGAVVEVVVPQRVEAVAARPPPGATSRGVLRLVLGHQQNVTRRPRARRARSRDRRPARARASRRGCPAWRPGEARRDGTRRSSSRRSRRRTRGPPPSRLPSKLIAAPQSVRCRVGDVVGGELRRDSCRPGRSGCRRRRGSRPRPTAVGAVHESAGSRPDGRRAASARRGRRRHSPSRSRPAKSATGITSTTVMPGSRQLRQLAARPPARSRRS